MLPRHFRSSVSVSGRMNGMVNSPAALGNDPCMVTGIRAINEPDEGLVELGIAVDCSGLTRPLPHQGVRAADRHGRWQAHQAIPKTP
jgi:hypothetical protein